MRAMDPYRGGQLIELWCPRCKTKKLPPVEVATCGGCHGVWVTAFASSIVLSDAERRRSHVSWWRVREHCPLCDEQMAVFGDDPFQGCEDHGYFIDADVVPRMRFSNGIDHAALDKKRAEWPSVPFDPELVRRAQRPYAERVIDRERERKEAAVERARAEAEAELRHAERLQQHAAEFEYLRKIELVAQSDEALVEALRPALGEIASAALLLRLRKLQSEIDSLAARLRYI
jgi:hypothetical protein